MEKWTSNSLIRIGTLSAALLATSLLAGCAAPQDRDEWERHLDEVPMGEPVETQEQAGTGRWHGSARIEGLVLFTVEFPHVEWWPEGSIQWFVRFAPDQMQGWIVMSGMTITSAFRGDSIDVLDLGGLAARTSGVIAHQGTVKLDAGSDGPYYLTFAAEALNTTGTIDVLIIWDGGPLRPWKPSLAVATNATLQEHILSNGSTFRTTIARAANSAVHLLMPCTWDEHEGQEHLHVKAGHHPMHIEKEGKYDDGTYENWLTYVGHLTNPTAEYPVEVTYRGSRVQEVALAQSDANVAYLLDSIHHRPFSFSTYGSRCALSPL